MSVLSIQLFIKRPNVRIATIARCAAKAVAVSAGEISVK